MVNGPDAPLATSHRSAWTLATVRRTSLWKLAFTPANNSVIANTGAVAATAIVNRRRRHCRSRRLSRHIAKVLLPPPVEGKVPMSSKGMRWAAWDG